MCTPKSKLMRSLFYISFDGRLFVEQKRYIDEPLESGSKCRRVENSAGGDYRCMIFSCQQVDDMQIFSTCTFLWTNNLLV